MTGQPLLVRWHAGTLESLNVGTLAGDLALLVLDASRAPDGTPHSSVPNYERTAPTGRREGDGSSCCCVSVT